MHFTTVNVGSGFRRLWHDSHWAEGAKVGHMQIKAGEGDKRRPYANHIFVDFQKKGRMRIRGKNQV